MRKKSIVAVIAALVICLVISPMSVYATAAVEEDTEGSYLYFVVQQDEIKEVSENEYGEFVEEQRSANSRTTGTWSINSSLIEAGQTMLYFQGNGEDFKVGAGEYIELEIDPELHSRTFGVGFTGTSEFQEEISLPIFKGARVAFIDALETPGEYRVLIRNASKKTEVVNGNIYIY